MEYQTFNSPDEVYEDYKGRRDGLLKALTVEYASPPQPLCLTTTSFPPQSHADSNPETLTPIRGPVLAKLWVLAFIGSGGGSVRERVLFPARTFCAALPFSLSAAHFLRRSTHTLTGPAYH
jgi:hypothetical protein